jgi:Aminotransferase class-III
MSTVTTNAELQKLRTQVLAAGVSSITPVHVESARGAILRDVEGKEYIDFGGGISVMNVSHSHPKVVAAIKAQADKFTHTCFMVNPYETAIRLADKLCRLTPGGFPKKAVFVNRCLRSSTGRWSPTWSPWPRASGRGCLSRPSSAARRSWTRSTKTDNSLRQEALLPAYQ